MRSDYDLIIAGGSIAGATFGLVAQRAGARVLIVEPERAFRDRVRGESIHPWGAAEIERLGVFPAIANVVHGARYWDTYVGPMRVERRDLPATTPAQQHGLNVHHPELQTALLDAARTAGAEVRRGARVARIEPGAPAAAEVVTDGQVERFSAALVAVADGRSSQLRQQLCIPTEAEPSSLLTCGVLLDGVRCDTAAISMFPNPQQSELALLIPLSRGRVRLYFIEPGERASSSFECGAARTDPRPTRGHSGAARLPPLLQRCAAVGVPAAWLEHAHILGPLATFDTTFVTLKGPELPLGVTLLGDAAGNVDPVFGCGQSLALRDVRVLMDAWHEEHDWQAAATRYMHARREYHAALLRIERWLTRILFTPGAEGDRIRALSFDRLRELGIDLIGCGPDSPHSADVERRLFDGTDTPAAGSEGARSTAAESG